ncbi:MAG TPA: MotA/TolQ/ExbB proton channel family protein [Armatimonadetes bacterium]|nr:MotA/TolQ/ExbB proton channel family protein [Armatimonadota bacterium]
MVTLFDLFVKGGPMMWPLLICSVLSLAFILDRLYVLLRQPTEEGPLVAQLEEFLSSHRSEEALSLCEAARGAIATVAAAGLRVWRTSREVLQETMERTGNEAVTSLERYLIIIRTVAEVAPLMGFLGTVTGMIKAFSAIAQAGLGKPEVVASGISEALITTASGLAIAIPTYIFYYFLVHRVEAITAAIERIASFLLEKAAVERESHAP